MPLFQIGECRVCGKNCLWLTPVDGVLAAFECCSYKCLAKCEEAQEVLKQAEAETAPSRGGQ